MPKVAWVALLTTFLLLGPGMLVGSALFANNNSQLLAKGSIAIGSVIEATSIAGDGEPCYQPVVEFVDSNGNTNHVRGRCRDTPSLGELVALHYEPGNPSNALIDEDYRGWLWFVLPGGLGTCMSFIGVGVAYAWWSLRRQVQEVTSSPPDGTRNSSSTSIAA